MPPQSGRGLLKEAGKPPGCRFLFKSHRRSRKTEAAASWLSSSEHLGPEVPGCSDLLTQMGFPTFPRPA